VFSGNIETRGTIWAVRQTGRSALPDISLAFNDRPMGVCTGRLTIILNTWAHANPQSRKPGDLINVNFNFLAQYAGPLCKTFH
jgi:riboflavin synthase alpha subunit